MSLGMMVTSACALSCVFPEPTHVFSETKKTFKKVVLEVIHHTNNTALKQEKLRFLK